MISKAGHIDPDMRIPGDDTDRPWRKSRLAARILFRKEAGRMTARDQRIGRRLAQDPEVTNRPRPRSSGCVGWAARPGR